MSTPSFASFSEKGLREKNEDASLAVEVDGMHLFAIAEGMGGPNQGSSAAEVAVNALRGGISGQARDLPGVLESCLIRADSALFQLQEANPGSEPPHHVARRSRAAVLLIPAARSTQSLKTDNPQTAR